MMMSYLTALCHHKSTISNFNHLHMYDPWRPLWTATIQPSLQTLTILSTCIQVHNSNDQAGNQNVRHDQARNQLQVGLHCKFKKKKIISSYPLYIIWTVQKFIFVVVFCLMSIFVVRFIKKKKDICRGNEWFSTFIFHSTTHPKTRYVFLASLIEVLRCLRYITHPSCFFWQILYKVNKKIARKSVETLI